MSDDWTLGDDDLEIIFKYIKENKPKVIVELGSGKSTVKIAKMLDYPCEFYSYEGRPEFWSTTKKKVKGLNVKLIHSPYHRREDGTVWFNEEDFKVDIDLLIIDAPEQIIGKNSRMLPQSIKAKTKFAFLHDMQRPEEKIIANLLGEPIFYHTKWGLCLIKIC